jgi:hypothetical protein
MRPSAVRLLGTLVALLALSGCRYEPVGYVEVRTGPASPESSLYLGTVKLEPLKGVAVVRQKVGTTRLQTDRSGHLAPICDIIVKKNRITTVTVSPLERPLRCQCRHNSGTDSLSNQACIS